jgi:hypothetical protein
MLTLAAVACPCDLQILLELMAGTSIGAVLAVNLLPAALLLSVIGTLARGLPVLEKGCGLASTPREAQRSR